MKFGKGLVALASASLIAAPVAAAAEPVDLARGDAPVAGAEGLTGKADMLVFFAILAGVVVAAFISMDDDDAPASP